MTSRSSSCSLRQAAKEECRVALRIYGEPNATPFKRMAFPRNQIFQNRNFSSIGSDLNFNLANRKPEFVDVVRKGDRHDNDILSVAGIFYKTDNIGIVHGNE